MSVLSVLHSKFSRKRGGPLVGAITTTENGPVTTYTPTSPLTELSGASYGQEPSNSASDSIVISVRERISATYSLLSPPNNDTAKEVAVEVSEVTAVLPHERINSIISNFKTSFEMMSEIIESVRQIEETSLPRLHREAKSVEIESASAQFRSRQAEMTRLYRSVDKQREIGPIVGAKLARNAESLSAEVSAIEARVSLSEIERVIAESEQLPILENRTIGLFAEFNPTPLINALPTAVKNAALTLLTTDNRRAHRAALRKLYKFKHFEAPLIELLIYSVLQGYSPAHTIQLLAQIAPREAKSHPAIRALIQTRSLPSDVVKALQLLFRRDRRSSVQESGSSAA